MKTGALILTLLVSLMVSGLAPGPVFAFEGEQDRALELRKQKDLIPYREIVRRAERRFDGRVVGQKLRERGETMIYELRILKENGKVIVVLYDAKTGRVIGTRGR